MSEQKYPSDPPPLGGSPFVVTNVLPSTTYPLVGDLPNPMSGASQAGGYLNPGYTYPVTGDFLNPGFTCPNPVPGMRFVAIDPIDSFANIPVTNTNGISITYKANAQPQICGFNKYIGCKPFENKSVETTVKNGVGLIKNREELTGLTVLFGNSDVPVGSTVYVLSTQINQEWVKREYNLEGNRFVLVPQDQIRLIKVAPPSYQLK